MGGAFGTLGGAVLKSCHSFDRNTRVLMADGTSKAIGDVQIGDKVTATEPGAGHTGPQPVTALHENLDNDLTDVTVSTEPRPSTSDGQGEGDGERSTRGPPANQSTIHTTAHHPFWDSSSSAWVDAAELTPGKASLRGPNGEVQYVTAVRNFTDAKVMNDLTVADVHTYYVIAGETPVLVHNCGTGGATPKVGSGNACSVAHEMDLPTSAYPGRSRGHHFQAANRDLLAKMDGDAAFGQMMEGMIPGIRNAIVGPRGGISRRSPTSLGWTWHHATDVGKMQLVPVVQHTAPGPLQGLFHPGGVGGFSIWG